MTFEVRNCENMANTLKIKVFRKSILFCKYLRNESLDLYEILFGGQLPSCELDFRFHEDPWTNARARVINMRNRDKTCARAFTTRARAYIH